MTPGLTIPIARYETTFKRLFSHQNRTASLAVASPCLIRCDVARRRTCQHMRTAGDDRCSWRFAPARPRLTRAWLGRRLVRRHLFIFRGKRGDYFKGLDRDGSGLWLIAKLLEHGRFVWPPIVDGAMTLTPAQFSVLIEAMDWRRTVAPAAPSRPMLV